MLSYSFLVDARNTLGEHLNVVVSTNALSSTLREVGHGSLEKLKKSLLMTNNVHCRFKFAQ